MILSCKMEIFLSQSDSSMSSQNLYVGLESFTAGVSTVSGSLTFSVEANGGDGDSMDIIGISLVETTVV